MYFFGPCFVEVVEGVLVVGPCTRALTDRGLFAIVVWDFIVVRVRIVSVPADTGDLIGLSFLLGHQACFHLRTL